MTSICASILWTALAAATSATETKAADPTIEFSLNGTPTPLAIFSTALPDGRVQWEGSAFSSLG
ncbi:MAG: hypothetical protein SGJ09_09145 [Phycisphaerae bacterium]|nr:hypothetical protein [Phycisphaerae bacterium]MDZ4830347.1 hypothetical protein [Phycisphaerae bacterium]